MKKKYPDVKFLISKPVEKRYFDIFGNYRAGLRPEARFVCDEKYTNTRRKLLNDFIDNFYFEYKPNLEIELEKTKKEWKKNEKFFFKQVDRIFGGHSWPKGNYRGYISIMNIFPRIISEKTFTFPAENVRFHKRYLAQATIAHEMLHFITYDFLKKIHKLKPSEYGNKDNKFWQFTENLNVLIENEDYWRIFKKGEKASRPYEDCKKLYARMKRVWNKNKDIDHLVNKILK